MQLVSLTSHIAVHEQRWMLKLQLGIRCAVVTILGAPSTAQVVTMYGTADQIFKQADQQRQQHKLQGYHGAFCYKTTGLCARGLSKAAKQPSTEPRVRTP